MQSEGGGQILRNVGLTLEALNVYQTAEPLAYYAKDKTVPQNVLIVENKDTFYTMRRYPFKRSGRNLGQAYRNAYLWRRQTHLSDDAGYGVVRGGLFVIGATFLICLESSFKRYKKPCTKSSKMPCVML